MTTATDTAERPFRSIWSHLMEVPFSQAYIDVGGIRTRYVQAGPSDAPSVVMVHGTGGHWEAFAANVGEYARHFNTYAFDMVGAGFADKPDVDYDVRNLAKFARDFILAVGSKKASVVGVSLGAQTALRMAVDWPEVVQKIVLVSPVGLKRFSPTADGNSEEEMAKRVKIVADTSWQKTREIFRGIIHEDHNVLPDLINIRQTIHRKPNAARDMAHVLAIGRPEVYAAGALTDDELRSLKLPVLVFESEHDVPFFRKSAAVIAELVPGARLETLDNVAHWAQFESPDYFNKVTIEFLKG